MIYAALIIAAVLLYYAGRSAGRQQERERQEFLQRMHTTALAAWTAAKNRGQDRR